MYIIHVYILYIYIYIHTHDKAPADDPLPDVVEDLRVERRAPLA